MTRDVTNIHVVGDLGLNLHRFQNLQLSDVMKSTPCSQQGIKQHEVMVHFFLPPATNVSYFSL